MTGAFVAAFTLAVALAMDAFAVALTQGAKFKPGWRHAAAIALAFGAFQGIMPLVGWLETPLKVPGSITEAVLGNDKSAKLAPAKA